MVALREREMVNVTTHVAAGAVALVELEVWGVQELQLHLAAVAAGFVKDFCGHGYVVWLMGIFERDTSRTNI